MTGNIICAFRAAADGVQTPLPPRNRRSSTYFRRSKIQGQLWTGIRIRSNFRGALRCHQGARFRLKLPLSAPRWPTLRLGNIIVPLSSHPLFPKSAEFSSAALLATDPAVSLAQLFFLKRTALMTSILLFFYDNAQEEVGRGIRDGWQPRIGSCFKWY